MATFGPFNVTPTLRPTQGGGGGGANVPTQEEIRQLREYIDSLQKGEGEGYGGRYTWANALADTVSGGVKGYERSKLASKAQEGAKYEEGKWDKLYQGQQSLQEQIGRALSGGGTAQGVPPESPLPKGLPEGALAMLDPAASPDSGSPPASSPLGLTTREPPSQQTLASAGPSTQIGRLLDTGGPPASAAEALLSPRSRLAQAQPSNALTRSPKDWNDLLGQSYFGMGGAYARRGYQPAEQALMADRARKGVEGVMPQYTTNDFGDITRTQAGKKPAYEGHMQGHPGQVGSAFGGAIKTRTYRDDNGNIHYQEIPLEETPEPSAAAPATPPATRGLAGGTQAPPAPTTAPAAPKTLLGANAPSSLQSQPQAVRVASLTNDATPVPISAEHPSGIDFGPKGVQVAQALPSSSDDIPKDKIQSYLDEADKNAFDPTKNIKKLPISPARTYEARTEAQKKAVEEQNKAQTESSQKSLDYLRNLGRVGRKLKPDFALAKEVIDDPEMVFGKGAALETAIRNMKGEAADLMERNGYKDQAAKLRAATYKPSAAEVYSKLMAGIVLQNLRSYLGENSGQFRVFELQLLQQAFGQGSMSKEANKAIMNLASNTNDRVVLINDLAEKYARKHNGIDPSFMEQMQRLEEEHPVYQPKKIMDIIRGDQKPAEAAPPPGIRIRP